MLAVELGRESALSGEGSTWSTEPLVSECNTLQRDDLHQEPVGNLRMVQLQGGGRESDESGDDGREQRRL